MQARYLLLGILTCLIFVSILSVSVNAKTWLDEECQTFCSSSGKFPTYCEEQFCPNPQCIFESGSIWEMKHMLGDKCASTGNDDRQRDEAGVCQVFNSGDHETNAGFFCSTNSDGTSSVKQCAKDVGLGIWYIEETFCNSGCNPSSAINHPTQDNFYFNGVCQNECDVNNVESECFDGKFIRYCSVHTVFRLDDNEQQIERTWGKYLYAGDFDFDEKAFYCPNGCVTYVDGKNKAKCKETCTLDDKKCFPVDASGGGVITQEIRECKEVTQDGSTTTKFIKDSSTILCPFGCKDISTTTDGNPTIRAECVNTESYDCNKLCKENYGDEYKEYSHGMCIDKDNSYGDCSVFGSFAERLSSDETTCDTYDFFAVDGLFVSKLDEMFRRLQSTGKLESFSLDSCWDDDFEFTSSQCGSFLDSNEDVFILSVSKWKGSNTNLYDIIQEMVDELPYSDSAPRYNNLVDSKEIVYQGFDKKYNMRKECCCALPYRPLKKASESNVVLGEKEYAESEPIPFKGELAENSCAFACWRQYNNQLTLQDMFNAFGGFHKVLADSTPSGIPSPEWFLTKNVGDCELVDDKKVSDERLKCASEVPVCSNAFLGYDGAERYDYRLEEGNRGLLDDSVHCGADVPDDKLSVCCCNLYQSSPDVQALIAAVNNAKKAIAHLEERDREAIEEIEQKINDIADGKISMYASFTQDLFTLHITNQKYRKQKGALDKMVEQVKKNPKSIMKVYNAIPNIRRINVLYDDGKSYGTLAIKMPSIQADFINQVTQGSFSIGGVYFDDKYLFSFNARPFVRAGSGTDDCVDTRNLDFTEVDGWTYAPTPYFVAFAADGSRINSLTSHPELFPTSASFDNFVENNAKAHLASTYGGNSLWGVQDEKGNSIDFNTAINDDRYSEHTVVEKELAYDGGDNGMKVYKARIKVPQLKVNSEGAKEKKACAGSSANSGIDVSFTAAKRFHDVLSFDRMTPILTTEYVNGAPRLNIAINFHSDKEVEGKEEVESVDMRFHSKSSFGDELQSFISGWSFSYKKKDRKGDIIEEWYDEFKMDPVQNKYVNSKSQGFGKVQDYIRPHLLNKDRLESEADVKEAARIMREKIEQRIKSDFFGGVLYENEKMFGEKINNNIVGYLGWDGKLNFAKKFFDDVSGSLWVEYQKNLNGDYFAGTGNSDTLSAFTLHAELRGLFSEKQGLAKFYTDINVGNVQQSRVGLDIIHKDVKGWVFSAGLTSELKDVSNFGYEVKISKKLFGSIWQIGAGQKLDGDFYLIFNTDIPLGYAAFIHKAVPYAIEGFKSVFGVKSRALDGAIPPKVSGISRIEPGVVGYNIPSHKFRQQINKLAASYTATIVPISGGTNVNKFVKTKECGGLGCRYTDKGKVDCVDTLIGSGDLKTDTIYCSGDSSLVERFQWYDTYPYLPITTCNDPENNEYEICREDGDEASCDPATGCPDGFKSCTEDNWHVVTCANNKNIITECLFGCVDEENGNSYCRGASCLSECEVGHRKCGVDANSVEECKDTSTGNRYVKIDQCILGCDAVNVQGSFACFEDNEVLQQNTRDSCGKEVRCSAEDKYIEKCNFYEQAGIVNKGYIYSFEEECVLGCSDGKCLEEDDINPGAKFCASDGIGLMEYRELTTPMTIGGVTYNYELVDTEETDCVNNGCHGQGAASIPIKTKRCSSDGKYVQEYTASGWKFIGDKCSFGCDPIENKCREEVTCEQGTFSCSGDGKSVQSCVNSKIGFTKTACPNGCEIKPDENDDCRALSATIPDAIHAHDGIFICSYDGMHSIELKDGQIIGAKTLSCSDGCDESTGKCIIPGDCEIYTETCTDNDVYTCREQTDFDVIDPIAGDALVSFKLKLDNIRGFPSMFAIHCTDGISSSYYLQRIDGITEWSRDFNLEIKGKGAEGHELIADQIRELRCSVSAYSDFDYFDQVVDGGTEGEESYYNYIKSVDGFPNTKNWVRGIALFVKGNDAPDGNVRIGPFIYKKPIYISDDFCAKKMKITGITADKKEAWSGQKCSWNEGGCSSDDECGLYTNTDVAVQLECQSMSEDFLDSFSDAIEADWHTNTKLCCKPWETVVCQDNVWDETTVFGAVFSTNYCKKPICVSDPKYEKRNSVHFCKYNKCDRNEGDCDFEEKATECNIFTDPDGEGTIQLICKDNPSDTEDIGLSEYPDLCCLPDERVIKISTSGNSNYICGKATGETCDTDEDTKRCDPGDSHRIQECIGGGILSKDKWMRTSYCEWGCNWNTNECYASLAEF